MNLILIGATGAGKGTQAAYIERKYWIPRIATGDMFRAAARFGSELGLQAGALMDAGHLVPDEVTIGIIQARLAERDCAKGFLLDGFPRTIAQAEALDDILGGWNQSIDAVINIEVSDQILTQRLSGRRVCSHCGANYHIQFNPPQQDCRCNICGGEIVQRSDDREETIAERLAVYAQQTRPLIEYYAHRGLLRTIDGNQSPEKVFEDIVKSLS